MKIFRSIASAINVGTAIVLVLCLQSCRRESQTKVPTHRTTFATTSTHGSTPNTQILHSVPEAMRVGGEVTAPVPIARAEIDFRECESQHVPIPFIVIEAVIKIGRAHV